MEVKSFKSIFENYFIDCYPHIICPFFLGLLGLASDNTKKSSIGLIIYSLIWLISVVWSSYKDFNTSQNMTKDLCISHNNNKEKSNLIQKTSKTVISYPRNKELKDICINRASFNCEINNNHQTFNSSKHNNYVEAHHIIPLSMQDKFNINLDSLENLICLCPLCHKAIHNGSKEVKLNILKQIYNIRKPFNISFEDLKTYYNI